MIICDICLKEEARIENTQFGEHRCDTCANKIYQSTQELKAEYQKEQLKNPVKTSEIKRLKPLGPEPKQHEVKLSENLGLDANV